jgi:hypothetical protein
MVMAFLFNKDPVEQPEFQIEQQHGKWHHEPAAQIVKYQVSGLSPQ